MNANKRELKPRKEKEPEVYIEISGLLILPLRLLFAFVFSF